MWIKLNAELCQGLYLFMLDDTVIEKNTIHIIHFKINVENDI